jgi:hypothetical protein
MHDIIESAVLDECITAPLVVQFLGVRSLVNHGATSTANRIVMKNEIERRKEVIVKTEYDVAKLMAAERQSDELSTFISKIICNIWQRPVTPPTEEFQWTKSHT